MTRTTTNEDEEHSLALIYLITVNLLLFNFNFINFIYLFYTYRLHEGSSMKKRKMISIPKKEIKIRPDDTLTKNKNDRELSYSGKNKNNGYPLQLERNVKRKESSVNRYNGKIYRKNAKTIKVCEKSEVLGTRLARDEKSCSSSKIARASTANPQGYSYTRTMSWKFKYANNEPNSQVTYKSFNYPN